MVAAMTVEQTSEAWATLPERARVLVVDDESAIVKIAVEALRTAGYEALGVATAEDALALDPTSFDVLVTDYRMPGLDGLDLYDRLRQAGDGLVGVLVTGYGTLGLVHSAMRTGFGAILLKPFRLDQLTAAVQRALRQRQRAEEIHRLGAVLDIYTATQQFAGLHRRDDVAHTLAQLAARQFGAREVAVLLTGSSQPELCRRYGPDDPTTQAAAEALLGQTVEAAEEMLETWRGRGVILQPMRYPPRAEGLLILSRSAPLQADEAERLTLLARQAAAALSQIRLAEEQLRAEKLALVGRLAGAIGEQVRGPVERIRSLAESLPVDEDDYRQMILETVARLEVMGAELGEFMAGEQAPCRERVDLAALLHDLARHWEPELRGRGITLEMHCAEPVPATVDAQKLARAIENLIRNSAEAMPEGGRLHLRLTHTGRTARLEIEDTGVGMPPEVAARWAEPFFTHGKASGTGLGGAIIQGAVQAHGGQIEVESAPGQGTRFRLELPV